MPAGLSACTNTAAPSASQASKNGSKRRSPIGVPLTLLPTSTPAKPSVSTAWRSSATASAEVLQRDRAEADQAAGRLGHHRGDLLVEVAQQRLRVGRLHPVRQQLGHGRDRLPLQAHVGQIGDAPRRAPAGVGDRAVDLAVDHHVAVAGVVRPPPSTATTPAGVGRGTAARCSGTTCACTSMPWQVAEGVAEVKPTSVGGRAVSIKQMQLILRIHAMDLRSVDLNLLVVFDALGEQRSVTRAAEALGMSQPATSAALARLRTLLDDPLFVKAGHGMSPTPRAVQLAPPVRRLLETVKSEILQAQAFDPATTQRTFTVLTPDIGEIYFIPRVLAHLAQVAPGANLKAWSLPPHAAAEALESGAAELAVGYFPDLKKAGFFQQRLFSNDHVCIVRRDHPTIGRTLTLRQFLAASHAVVRPEGREHVFEQFLQGRGLQRRVRLEVSHFMSLLPIISATDLVATVPRDLAEVCVRHGDIRLVETALKSPGIEVHQFWHRRFHKDAAHGWFRVMVQALFGRGRGR